MNLPGLELKLKQRRTTSKAGPFAELDAKLAKYVADLKTTRAAVKKAGGARVRMSQLGQWSCRMRLRKRVGKDLDGKVLYESRFDRLEAATSAGLLEQVAAWQAANGRTPKESKAA